MRSTTISVWLYLATLTIGSFCTTVKVVDADTINAYAGSGVEGFNGDGIAATTAQLDPESKIAYVAVDGDKNIYIADPDNHRVRKVDASSGLISTVAGTGVSGNTGDGGSATAATLNGPLAVTVASNGDLYISDTGNDRIRKVTASSGVISAFGGALSAPRGLAIDGNNNLYVAAHDAHKVYKYDSGGNQSDFAGTGVATCAGGGGAPSSALTTTLRYVHDVAVGSDGNVYLAEPGCFKIRKVDVTTGIISTVAGDGNSGNTGDGGLATAARLNEPRGIALDQSDNVFISVAGGEKLRKIDATTGNIATFAGTGATGNAGDGGDALSATMEYPVGVAVDCEGSVYFYDGNNFRVRKISLTSPTICGGGSTGSSGDPDQIRYVPFASKYLLMALMALLGGWLVLRRH